MGLTGDSPAPAMSPFVIHNGNKLTVSAHKPIKAIYIKKFVKLVTEGTGD